MANGEFDKKRRKRADEEPDTEIWVGLQLYDVNVSNWNWTDGSEVDGPFLKSLFYVSV